MFKNIQIPSSFSLIEKGKVSLLLKEEYKNPLLKQGIDDLKTFLNNSSQTSHYLKGRTLHPSIPLEDGKRMVFRQYSHGGLLTPEPIRSMVAGSGTALTLKVPGPSSRNMKESTKVSPSFTIMKPMRQLPTSPLNWRFSHGTPP